MKISIIFLVLIILSSIFINTSYAKPCSTKYEVDTLVSSINEFSLALYRVFSSENPADNMFFSPFSISAALAMTYVGASGNTKTEMAEVLKLTLSDMDTHKAFHDLLSDIERKGKGYILNVANALWGDKGYNFLPLFLNTIKKYYNGGFYEVGFHSNPEKARVKINDWVEKKTREKIKNLLPSGSITPLTRLVITNAIYFKGKWATEFNKKATKPMPFYLTSNDEIEVPMMYQKGKFKYIEEKGKFQMLEIPYEGKTLSMAIILPAKNYGLAEIEKNITWTQIEKELMLMRTRKVEVYLPKFKMEKKYSLTDSLKNLGMEDAFNPDTADFSKMEPKRELYITNVFHKAYIDVNEQGTEAAAATGVIIATRAMVPAKTPIFKADHPFLFMIIHNKTGAILFTGKLSNPIK